MGLSFSHSVRRAAIFQSVGPTTVSARPVCSLCDLGVKKFLTLWAYSLGSNERIRAASALQSTGLMK